MKKAKINLVTFDNQKININPKHIKELYLNGLTTKMTYIGWLKDGFFGEKTYLLCPESLKYLVEYLDGNDVSSNLNTTSSKVFLEYFPSTKLLQERLQRDNIINNTK